jgi:hypothetical protein
LFELEKHYFDAIDADGVLTIVYDCILRVFYGVLRWSYSSRQETGGDQRFAGNSILVLQQI